MQPSANSNPWDVKDPGLPQPCIVHTSSPVVAFTALISDPLYSGTLGECSDVNR